MPFDKEKARSEYSQKLRDPRWQKKRLEVMQRDEFTCRVCFDSESTLNVHHKFYEQGRDPWDYDIYDLLTLCESCHTAETEERRDAESNLLLILKRAGFLSGHLKELTDAIGSSDYSEEPAQFDPNISALAMVLNNRDEMFLLRERYFESLKSRSKARADDAK